ncbi:hypothetical protein E3Q06_02001 [Wallemia mellicola]|uniref:Cupin type-1 domain-containing protein n=1 Tax=Wallemia mellicola TaxID=1708541 RepID=A0AB38N0Y7_9BASI|nr:hypothetical protein E3Q21_01045 [Wallemia mellicola]TIB91175.1 hypothetical protein E3Q20_01032 [Wallemia mellicola]TIC40686.1 hypothetical protein E3Q07_02080 [Wallemia mellicola]TIC49194.1 hypothetical protein E3Q06_02001 [Wallemia mellicola]TIC71376.1 hypothetical protein E3Q02_00070 [Wallemia mellicola]
MSIPGHTFTNLFSYPLPEDSTKVIVGLKVGYEAGASTPKHHHGMAFVVGTVLQGSIRSVVHQPGAAEPDPLKIHKTNESWSELPGALHVESGNASETEPAEFIAIFVAPREQKDFVVFDCEICKVAKEAAKGV